MKVGGRERPWRIERDGTDLAKSKEDTIVWKPGDPVHYDDLSAAEMKTAVRRILAEQGFAQAKFDVELGPRDSLKGFRIGVDQLAFRGRQVVAPFDGDERNNESDASPKGPNARSPNGHVFLSFIRSIRELRQILPLRPRLPP